jgi:UDP-N-acetyl-D-glucosamine/UDP-N-acetyl-D-galactosamine dehydrogenase
MLTNSTVVAVVGLGYVGLPLAIEFGKKFRTIGYDQSIEKIAAYRNYRDPTGEVKSLDIMAAKGLEVTTDPRQLSSADFIIIAVPTPVDKGHRPNFSPLMDASKTVGLQMKPGVTVIYESTVYPGATEEVCIPILERESGRKWKKCFHVGYSPERINPGDKEHTLTKIIKVVSGDDEVTLKAVGDLYESIISAGVYRASSIQVAEAAKVIENTQRDLNIALMNELSIIFDKIGIDTFEVLKAAQTKWNFLPFYPGLVGGHCIGVDPYYLTHKAEMVGYHPQVILSGRRINDGMAAYIAQQTVKKMIKSGNIIKTARVVVLGLTFKENCSDIRNSKVFDLILELQDYGCEVLVHDPLADSEEVYQEFGLTLTSWEFLPLADALISAVSHRYYLEMPLEKLGSKLKPSGLFVDVMSAYPRQAIEKKGWHLWRL